jgi:hypothetical protein
LRKCPVAPFEGLGFNGGTAGGLGVENEEQVAVLVNACELAEGAADPADAALHGDIFLHQPKAEDGATGVVEAVGTDIDEL